MNLIEIVQASGETMRVAADKVIYVDRLGEVAELKLIGRDPVFLTWLQGRCERLLRKPADSERIAVKFILENASHEECIVACEKAELT